MMVYSVTQGTGQSTLVAYRDWTRNAFTPFFRLSLSEGRQNPVFSRSGISQGAEMMMLEAGSRPSLEKYRYYTRRNGVSLNLCGQMPLLVIMQHISLSFPLLALEKTTRVPVPVIYAVSTPLPLLAPRQLVFTKGGIFFLLSHRIYLFKVQTSHSGKIPWRQKPSTSG